jgi:serine/threonine protein kinase
MTSKAFLEEASIMKALVHPNLIRLYAVCTTEEPYYIVCEFMKNGSLLVYLRNEKNQLNLKCLIDIGAQVANGMMYLEERNLIHRDLAARNVLVGEKIAEVPVVKIADFGLARALRDEGVYEVQSGTKIPVRLL